MQSPVTFIMCFSVSLSLTHIHKILSLFRKLAGNFGTKAAKSERTKQENSATSTTSDAFTVTVLEMVLFGEVTRDSWVLKSLTMGQLKWGL